ncbi:hypothetical protein ABIA10_005739 [Rhizobium leguminosarum]
MTDLIDIQNLEIAFGGGQVRAVRGRQLFAWTGKARDRR